MQVNNKYQFSSIVEKLLLICFFVFLPLGVSAQGLIQGRVVDEETGESIIQANVRYKKVRVGTVTDLNGRFTIRRIDKEHLTISVMGYKSKTVDIDDDTEKLFIALKPDVKSLNEVSIKKKRTRYKRKNNPAVELMRRVIANKKKTDLGNKDYYQYQKYQKLTLALNDVKPKHLENPKFAKFPWLINQVEMNEQTGKLILPLSVDETVSKKIYRRSPHDEKIIVTGQKSSGINDFFETGDIINTATKDIFTDVNIYDDQIRILQHPFTSPIGSGAISFYRYYIEDTLQIDRDSVIHLHFLPNNQQDFGFRGDLYVLKDSSCQVKRCELILPNRTDVNFVEDLKLIQEFTKLPTGEWVLSVDDMVVQMIIYDFLFKGVAIRTTRLSDYTFDEIPKQMFRGREAVAINPDARMQDDDFWEENRKARLTRGEESMDGFLASVKKTRGFGPVMTVLKILTENFIETSEKSKVDLGPILSSVSSNFIDGLRLRMGAMTTANLNPHLFLKGFFARGMKSKNSYYNTQLTWSLNKKKYLPDEFPKRNITFLTTYDAMSPSDKYLSTDKDNLFTSFRWTKADKMMFYNRQRLTFEREEVWGFRSLLSLKTEENEAAGNMTFIPLSMSSLPLSQSCRIRTTELRAEIEYSPGALFVNSKTRRLKVNREAPILTLSHTIGFKGFLGGDYRYNYTEFSVFKRFWLSSWGRIDTYTRAGMQWNQVPFIMLCMPSTNLSYISHKHTFQLMTNMEFMTDRFVSFDFNWDMQGKIFNRIPLLKKLRWREYIGAKVLWGELSDKNNPYLEENKGSDVLMMFPSETRILDSKRPYWEISLGIRSILRFFQVEYVRRMNYNDNRFGPKNSVRLGFTMMF